MSFPDKQQREACWGSKDRYWECLDTSKGSEEMCKELRKLYESSCPAQWVSDFFIIELIIVLSCCIS